MRSTCLFSSLLAVSATACSASEIEPDIFADRQTAIAFIATFGENWKAVSKVQDGFQYDDVPQTRIVFEPGYEMTFGRLSSSPGAEAALTLTSVIDYRFPQLAGKCQTPNGREFAKKLIEWSEPKFASNPKHVNLLGSIADLVWRDRISSSGPSASLGKTHYQFFQMNGRCSITVKRFNTSIARRN